MSAGSRTITDRLARYDAAGNLTCLVCKTSISHDALWKAHVLGKEHLHAIEALKQKKAQSAPAAASVARPAATTAPKSALPSDFFDSSSSAPAKAMSAPAPPAPTPISTPAAVPATSTPSTGAAPKNDPTAVPAGFFDDPLTEMQVRQVKIDKPDYRNELKALELEIKQSAADQNKISEEFQQQLAPLRELELQNEQAEYLDRAALAHQKGADVKRRLEEMRAARRAKVPRTESNEAPAAPAATAADAADALNVDWKTKAVAARVNLPTFDPDQFA